VDGVLSALAAEVLEVTGSHPVLLIREGEPREELLAQMEEGPRISMLVLASAAAQGTAETVVGHRQVDPREPAPVQFQAARVPGLPIHNCACWARARTELLNYVSNPI
jgi:hypothetical protein